jgi:hypothetical protein
MHRHRALGLCAGEQKQRAAPRIDLRDPAADIAVELIEIGIGLEPGAYQRDVRHAGSQQTDGHLEVNILAEGMKARSHGREHPAILANESRGFFFREFTAR